MALKGCLGPYSMLASWKDMVYGTNCMVHLVFKYSSNPLQSLMVIARANVWLTPLP